MNSNIFLKLFGLNPDDFEKFVIYLTITRKYFTFYIHAYSNYTIHGIYF